MPDFYKGYLRIIEEVLDGLVISVVISILVQNGLLDPLWAIFLSLIFTCGAIMQIEAMFYWSAGYLSGWVVGLIIMTYVGLVNIYEFILYFFSSHYNFNN